jgi:hypothetical protein
METKSFNIELGVGVGLFKFGMSREALRQKAGEPDEIEKNDDELDDEGHIEVWHYDDYDLSVEFIEGNDWHLSTIAVNSENCFLGDVCLIGKNMSEVTSFIEATKLGEYEMEKLDLDDHHEVVLVSVFDAGLNLWFEAGVLTEIQLAPTD